MKEATGELNMTVIAIVAIAAVGAFFYAFIWPAIQRSVKNNTRCSDAICPSSCTSGTCECQWINDNGVAETIHCKAQQRDTNN